MAFLTFMESIIIINSKTVKQATVSKYGSTEWQLYLLTGQLKAWSITDLRT